MKKRSITLRPDVLCGKTYKIHPPNIEHAFYVVINDGNVDGCFRPFEMFINSANMESFQWITSLTRMISAIFRMGGTSEFVIEELESIHDMSGGYWAKGKHCNSIVAEIATVLREHVATCPNIKKSMGGDENVNIEVMVNLGFCPRCQHQRLKLDGGCETCLACDYSKCN